MISEGSSKSAAIKEGSADNCCPAPYKGRRINQSPRKGTYHFESPSKVLGEATIGTSTAPAHSARASASACVGSACVGQEVWQSNTQFLARNWAVLRSHLFLSGSNGTPPLNSKKI